MKKSKELLGLCCPSSCCDYWEKPPMVSIDYEIQCPHCKVELESCMGHYEIEPAKWTWYGRTKPKYVNFIKHERMDPVAGMLFTGDIGKAEHVLPKIGNLGELEEVSVADTPQIIKEELLRTSSPTEEDPSGFEESGKRLGEMLLQFTGGDEVGEQLRAQDRDDEMEALLHKAIPADKIGVHETHCCIVHGCKYGNRNCPVVLGEIKQEYICEECDVAEGWTSLLDVETKVREQQGGMLPYISHENFAKLYPKWETTPRIEDYFEEYKAEAEDSKFEFENGLTRRQHACFEMYRLISSPTVLEKLYFIEGMKVIYDIHYCSAGVGIVFYYKDQDIGDYRSGLSVARYYDNFEDCISGEASKIYAARMSWLG